MENREYHNIKINRGEAHVHLRRFSAKPTPTREAYAKPTQMHMCFSSYISLQLIPANPNREGMDWTDRTGVSHINAGDFCLAPLVQVAYFSEEGQECFQT